MTGRDRVLVDWSRFLAIWLVVLVSTLTAHGGTARLASDSLVVEIDEGTGGWVLVDKRSSVQWPSVGMASPGDAAWLRDGLTRSETATDSIRLIGSSGGAVVFALVAVFSALVMVGGGIQLVTRILATQQVSPALGLKMGYVYLAVPISGFFLALYSVELCVEILVALAKGKIIEEPRDLEAQAGAD